MSFITKIGHVFKVIAKGIAHGFVALVGSDVAKAFVNAAKGILKTPIGQLALDAVTAIESLSPTASNHDKRAAAFAKLTADALTAGLTVSESMANLLLEVAVSVVKGKIVE